MASHTTTEDPVQSGRYPILNELKTPLSEGHVVIIASTTILMLTAFRNW
jgi:hypothetical protein